MKNNEVDLNISVCGTYKQKLTWSLGERDTGITVEIIVENIGVIGSPREDI